MHSLSCCAALLLVACGSPDSTARDGRPGGGDGGGDGPGSGDLGPSRGGIGLTQQSWVTTSQPSVMRRTTAGGGFYLDQACADQPITSACTRLVSCPAALVGAGPITITGANGGPIALAPSAGGTYSYIDSDPTPFSAGAAVTFSAAGAPAFPAFTGSVTAPDALASLSPDPLAGAVALSTTSDTLISWSPGSGDSIDITVFGGQPFAEVSCSGPDTGTFAIPAAVVQQLAPGTVSIAIARSRRTAVAVAHGHVELYVMAEVEGVATIGGGIATSCSSLAACCPRVPPAYQAQCETDVVAGDATMCASDLSTAISAGYCP